jgi:subtilisin family serine protease
MVNPLDIVNLTPLMDIASGKAQTIVALIDGPVALSQPAFAGRNIREISTGVSGRCTQTSSVACTHGTFLAGILCANRGSNVLSVCPDCTLLIRPIFIETTLEFEQMPTATPEALAAAIIESIDSGAQVINMSIALTQPSFEGERKLEEALNYAVRRGVITVAAAGNQGTLASSVITRHAWVVPVVACDSSGKPINSSNLGSSIGRRGLMAPGDAVKSIGVEGEPVILGGTSVAAPFVTGTIALLWSEFPTAKAIEVKSAVTQVYAGKRKTVVPPLLDAWAAYQVMAKTRY